MKTKLPHQSIPILISYLRDRYFLVKQQDEYTELHPIKLGVPQGSVLRSVFYVVYSADLPSTNTEVATFADDTTVLTLHSDPTKAPENLQGNLDKIGTWLKQKQMKPSQHASLLH